MIAVITTVQPPTESVYILLHHLGAASARLIVVGDQKGPRDYPIDGAHFFSLQDQLDSSFRLAAALPTGHYARKNLGYLIAAREGADCIYETDDDNAPNQFWAPRSSRTRAREIQARPWANVYRMFSAHKIWPRGFPLDLINDPNTFVVSPGKSEEIVAPIQQGLANGSPDVDAVWRLVLDRDFQFDRNESILLPAGAWCPFNSQTTWWWPSAYPLLYLPSYCSFRMTDIWRSFIAQRCIWELGFGIVFHPPEVQQQRNIHNLMRDFEDEVPGYLHNASIAEILDSLALRAGAEGICENLRACYEALVRAKILPEKELTLVDLWLQDLTAIG